MSEMSSDTRTRVADAMNSIEKVIGPFNRDEQQSFIMAMLDNHRTHQQSFTRLCIAWLVALSEKYVSNQYDQRNEASCKLAHEIVKEFELEYLGLPNI